MAFTGYRRRIVITPEAGRVTAVLEDDYHCMLVRLEHDGVSIVAVHAETQRAPWSTCPGAVAVVQSTFTGAKLGGETQRALKKANCTHLYDIALLAANHALDLQPTCFDVFTTDPVDGYIVTELYRNDTLMLHWTLDDFTLTAPAELVSRNLFEIRDWIAEQPPQIQEAARILQWASIIAHGRKLPLDQQSDATRMAPVCFTFQPDVAPTAKRVGKIIDFSSAENAPLDHFDGTEFSLR